MWVFTNARSTQAARRLVIVEAPRGENSIVTRVGGDSMKHTQSERQMGKAASPLWVAKKIVKRCYQGARCLAYRAEDKARLHKQARLVELPLHRYGNSFFGYYNRSPWNANGDILFQETTGRRKRASLYERLELKVYRPSKNEVETIGETNAWNWQQGCMLQWLGAAGKRVIYNAYSVKHDAYYSMIANLVTGDITRICQPIYSVNPQGTDALTLNFSRLARLRPDYGYFNKKVVEGYGLAEDGIWTINLVRNESRLILSLKEIIDFEHSDDMDNVEHKVNHIDISPDGNRFLFLHRWFPRGCKATRLLTADLEGKNLYCLANDRMVSHCIWRNEEQVLAWARKEGVGDRYFLFTDRSREYEIVGEGCLDEDGHPSFSPDGRWLLTDTYPDKNRMSSLMILDLRSNNLIKLGAFLQPLRFRGEIRCDLHPRWSLDGNFVSFDSCHTGRRRFYVLDVSDIVHSRRT